MFGMKEYYEDRDRREEAGLSKMMENMSELYEQIKEETGIKDINFKSVIWKDRGVSFINLESDDFAEKFKVLRNAWKSFKIKATNGGFWSEKNSEGVYGIENDVTKPCPEIGYTMEVCYKYIHNDGGSNGATIGHAYASEKTEWKWEFKLNKNEEE